mmetsp:Transcript_68745/g.102193  ORF Transcript_68745/g.102193 Transcript_68745/m.102193 type:complete len:135 (+) Transcript_68745:428-832(+)
MTFIIAEEMKNPKIKPILSKIKLLIESKQEQIQKAFELFTLQHKWHIFVDEIRSWCLSEDCYNHGRCCSCCKRKHIFMQGHSPKCHRSRCINISKRNDCHARKARAYTNLNSNKIQSITNQIIRSNQSPASCPE